VAKWQGATMRQAARTAAGEYRFGRWISRRLGSLGARYTMGLGPEAELSAARRRGLESTGRFFVFAEVADCPGDSLHGQAIAFLVRDWEVS